MRRAKEAGGYAAVLVLMVFSSGCGQNGRIDREEWKRLLIEAVPRTPPVLLEKATHGNIDERMAIVVVARAAMKDGDPQIAEAAIPLMLTVMTKRDFVVKKGLVICPSLDAASWFDESTTVRGCPDEPTRDRGVAVAWGYSFEPENFKKNWNGIESTLRFQARMCAEWYEARKGKLKYNDSKWQYKRRYYGEGMDEEAVIELPKTLK